MSKDTPANVKNTFGHARLPVGMPIAQPVVLPLGLQVCLGDWLRACRQRLNPAPACARDLLVLNGETVGSAVASVMATVAHRWASPSGAKFEQRQHLGSAAWHLEGDARVALAELANSIRQNGLAGPWRNELLSVRNTHGHVCGAVERGVVRVLGIATQAVHLTGYRANGHVWLQLRALTKANDPGLWDTLVGGLVAHGETLADCLARETQEEAGLNVTHLHKLAPLQQSSQFGVNRPSPDGGGTGHMLETLHWTAAEVPDDQTPENQDGEVERFECVSPQELAERIVSGQCTDEAAVIFAAAMGWHNLSA